MAEMEAGQRVKLGGRKYLVVGKTFGSATRMAPGDKFTIESEQANVEETDAGPRLSLWVPEVIEPTDAAPDSLAAIVKRAREHGVLREKRRGEGGKLEYLPNDSGKPATAEKQNILLSYPPESKTWRFVAQEHFRGKSAHLDLRFEAGDYLVGWTVPNQVPGAIEEPVTTLAAAKDALGNPDLWKMDMRTGVVKPRQIRGGTVRRGDLRAMPKGTEIPEAWLEVEGVTEEADPGEEPAVGATRNYPGVFAIVDRGTVEFGAQKPWVHEAFVHGKKWDDQRWLFRLLGREGKADVLPEGVEEPDAREGTYWVLMQPEDSTPYTLSKEAVDKDWLPPKGVSALPKAIRSKIPKELRYWEASGKRALDMRRRIVEELDVRELAGTDVKWNPDQPRDEQGRFGSGGGGGGGDAGGPKVSMHVTNERGIRREHYEIEGVPGSTMQVVTRTDGRRSVSDVYIPEEFQGRGLGQTLYLHALDEGPLLSKRGGVGQITQAAINAQDGLIRKRLAETYEDEYDVPMLRITKLGREKLHGAKAEKQAPEWRPYLLQRHWWRGPIQIRFGASEQHYDLRVKLNGKHWHLVVDGDPLTNDRLPAYEETKYSGSVTTADGKRINVMKIGKGEVELAPGQPANPTKDTPAWIETVDEGRVRFLSDSPEFKKLEFEGGKIKGVWAFRLEEAGGEIGEFGKEEAGPSVKAGELDQGEKGVRPLFGSPGGKRLLAKTIVDLILPHKTYCEPFVGGGAVLFAKEPSQREVIGDADPDIAFAYRTVKNLTDAEIERLNGMEWRIGQFDKVKESKPSGKLGRLHKWLFLRRMSQGSLGTSPQRGRIAEAGLGYTGSKADSLPRARERLSKTEIRHADYRDTLKSLDAKDTFFYLDPPYPETNLGSSQEKLRWTDEDVVILATALKGTKGKWLLSLQDNDTNRDLFRDYNIRSLTVPGQMTTEGNTYQRKELLIANYPLPRRIRRK